jgi:hypothetical protein
MSMKAQLRHHAGDKQGWLEQLTQSFWWNIPGPIISPSLFYLCSSISMRYGGQFFRLKNLDLGAAS